MDLEEEDPVPITYFLSHELQKKRLSRNLRKFFDFIDLQKAYNWVPLYKICEVLAESKTYEL